MFRCSVLDKLRRKMTFAAIHRINPPAEMRPAAKFHTGPAKGNTGIHQLQIRMRLQQPLHIFFIFSQRERAGTVYQCPAGSQTLIRRLKNRSLPLGTEIFRIFVPLPDRVGILAEHPFPGTWRIAKHRIKVSRKLLGNYRRIRIQNQTVRQTEALHIFLKYSSSTAIDFICDQQPLILHQSTDLSCLGTGCRTKIKHAHARFWIENRHGTGSTRLLQIEHSRGMRR